MTADGRPCSWPISTSPPSAPTTSTAQQPPSPLQNYWSLAVEEQFYLVYPTIFLLIAAIRSRLSLHARLAVALTMVATASFLFSVIQTTTTPTVAYFSPFTRAWELALGALVAVGTRWLLTIPHLIASVMTWIGLAAIGVAAVAFTASTAYPGALVAIPVIGAALVIAGGVANPPRAAESVLGRAPFRWLGRLSYSMYLWHWPILIIAADAAGKSSLPFRQNAVWLLVALAASVATYHLVENPIRHAVLPGAGRWVPIGLGIVLVAASVGVATVELQAHAGSVRPIQAAAGTSAVASVEQLIRAAPQIHTVPPDLTPSIAAASTDWGGPAGACWPAIGQDTIPTCEFGDPHGNHTLVLYGDSHAGMWLDAVSYVAIRAHWKVAYLGKGDCPADNLRYTNPPGWGAVGGEYSVCDRWHRFAIDRINRLRPDLVVITQDAGAGGYTSQEWASGLVSTMDQIQVPKNRIVVLGNIPELPHNPSQCLARNSDVQQCSGKVPTSTKMYNVAEQTAATSVGAGYIDVTPWFCTSVCTPIVGHYNVYFDQFHVTLTYGIFLEPLLGQALNLPSIK